MDQIIETLSAELGRPAQQVENVVTLIDEGATIPFIARYRKELHGSMDDQLLRQLAERLQYLRNLDQRKGEIKTSIENQGKLTDELSAAIDAAKTLAEAEDLYRPYKQKRRTRATIAREKGLAPLAQLLFAQGRDCPTPEAAAADFINPEEGVDSIEAALQGASDIIAEEISDDAAIRKELRSLFLRRGVVVSKAADKEPEDTVYRLYYDFKCPVSRIQGYQVLAINRAIAEATEESHQISTLRANGLLDADICAARMNAISARLAQLRGERRRLTENEVIDETMDALRKVEQTLLNGPERLDCFDEELFEHLVEKIIAESQNRIRFRLYGGLELTEQWEVAAR